MCARAWSGMTTTYFSSLICELHKRLHRRGKVLTERAFSLLSSITFFFFFFLSFFFFFLFPSSAITRLGLVFFAPSESQGCTVTGNSERGDQKRRRQSLGLAWLFFLFDRYCYILRKTRSCVLLPLSERRERKINKTHSRPA